MAQSKNLGRIYTDHAKGECKEGELDNHHDQASDFLC
jgi:hypothetical protein